MEDGIHTAEEYARVRESVGSQKDVARMLGVDIRTVQRRECGEIVITDEAVRALHALSTLSYLKNLIADKKIPDLGKLVFLLGNE